MQQPGLSLDLSSPDLRAQRGQLTRGRDRRCNSLNPSRVDKTGRPVRDGREVTVLVAWGFRQPAFSGKCLVRDNLLYRGRGAPCAGNARPGSLSTAYMISLICTPACISKHHRHLPTEGRAH